MQCVFIFKLHFSYLLNRWLRGALCAYVMEGGGGGGSTFLAIVISSLFIAQQEFFPVSTFRQ
jgi:hypothetical protein